MVKHRKLFLSFGLRGQVSYLRIRIHGQIRQENLNLKIFDFVFYFKVYHRIVKISCYSLIDLNPVISNFSSLFDTISQSDQRKNTFCVCIYWKIYIQYVITTFILIKFAYIVFKNSVIICIFYSLSQFTIFK